VRPRPRSSRPCKPNQNNLDAVICALCGYLWCLLGTGHSVVVGDIATGYIVAPTNPTLHAELTLRAKLTGVPVS